MSWPAHFDLVQLMPNEVMIKTAEGVKALTEEKENVLADTP